MSRIDWIPLGTLGECHAYYNGRVATIHKHRSDFFLYIKPSGKPSICRCYRSLGGAKRAGAKLLKATDG